MKLAGQIRAERGYAMAALLVGLTVMSVLMGMALPVWSQMAKREKEEELIWRGLQYQRAVGLFMRKFANTFPPTLDVLVEQRFLRKKYKDPITNDDFQLIPAGGGPQMPGQGSLTARAPGMAATQPSTAPPTQPQPGQGGRGLAPGGGQIVGSGAINLGIMGVVSKSKDASIKIYNGRQKYNEWAFAYLQAVQSVGPGGVQFPGGRGQPGGRGGPFQPMGPGGRGGFPDPGGFPGRGGPPGGRGFQPPPGPFGQPGQPGQPGQFGQPPFGQPGQQPPFTQPPFGRGQSTRPPGD